MNGKIKQVIDAWPIFVVVGGLLLGYSELWIDRKIDNKLALLPAVNVAVDPKIIAMDSEIQANEMTVANLKTGQDEIKAAIVALDLKLDRTIEIMLTED